MRLPLEPRRVNQIGDRGPDFCPWKGHRQINIDTHDPAAFAEDQSLLEEIAQIVGLYIEQHVINCRLNQNMPGFPASCTVNDGAALLKESPHVIRYRHGSRHETR